MGSNCELCGGRLHAEQKTGKFNATLTYHTCNDCCTSYLDEAHRKDPASYYPGEYAQWFSQGRGWDATIRNAFSDATARTLLLSAFVPLRNCTVLDVGCGYAGTLALLRELGAMVMGIEPSESCARFDREVLRLPVFEGFLEQFASNNRFTLVTLFDVIEHTAQPAAMLRAVHHLLSDEGVILLTTPHNQSGTSSIIFQQSHLFLFSLHSLQQILKRTGFAVSRVLLFRGALNVFARKASSCDTGPAFFPPAMLEQYHHSFLRTYGTAQIIRLLPLLPRLARYHFISRRLLRGALAQAPHKLSSGADECEPQ